MKEFDAGLFRSGHSLIIGDNKVKDNIVRELIRSYDPWRGALVVLDYDGTLYESFGGEAVLADFSSKESAMPDILETLLRSKKYGADIKTFAAMMQKLHAIPKPDKGSNDAFWSAMGTAAFMTYIEYLCAVYKIDKLAAVHGAGCGNGRRDLALLGSRSGEMMQIMREVTISQRDNDKKERDLPSEQLYQSLRRYVKRSCGKNAEPFDGTLRNPGAQYSGTFQSIYMSMLSIADSFFKMMEMFQDKGEYLSGLPELTLSEFIARPSAPLFLCGTRSPQANRALGASMLMASAAAAHDAGSAVTVVIPALERWDLYDALSYVKAEALNGFSTVVSFSNLSKLAAGAGADKRGMLTSLIESSDRRLWLNSTDSVCEELFELGSTVRERSYRLNELGMQFAAYRESGKDVEYIVLPEPAPYSNCKTRTAIECGSSDPWIDRLDGWEEELNALAFRGLPEDLFYDMQELGYLDGMDGADESFLDEACRHITEDTYAVKALCRYLMDDKKRLTRSERELRYSMLCGKQRLSMVLARCDFNTLVERCRRTRQRELSQQKRGVEQELNEKELNNRSEGESGNCAGSSDKEDGEDGTGEVK
ncbi:hypothetical protein [uncultured Cloacibacillus sp.]|uniref:hypothetical protein n=1 Tax=uncultured Cloacibacillus sp. TaxID=889794 RepID=UPI0026DD2FBA|nr:hypothetical protein [uncultured Cloacibacillus sp.]